MAKKKQHIRFERHSQNQKREDFTDQGIEISWSFITDLIEILKKAKQNRIERNRVKNAENK